MKKPIFILIALLIIGLGLFTFTREAHEEPVSIRDKLCGSGDISCHGDGIHKYKTMTPLSTVGVIIVGVSAVGLLVVLGNQAVKKRHQDK